MSQASLAKIRLTSIGRETAKIGRELMGGNGILIENFIMTFLLDIEGAYTGEGSY